MNQSRIHVRTIRLVSLLLLLLAGVAGAAANRPAPIIAATPPQPLFHATQPLAGLSQNETPVTTITVTTVTDNDNLSLSETCASVAADPQDSRCTLRRAIVQARTLPADQRPVLIAFDLPASESNDAADPAYWQMQVTGGSVQSPLGSTTGANLDGGQIILDGITQPGGRTDGPKVFIPGTPQFDRLVIDDESNIIRGVGFLGLRLIFNGSTNLFEQSWLGLTPDGQQIYLVNDDPIRDNNAAIEEAESSEGNSFRDNVITGGRTHAISKRGNNGTITNNLIGTRSDGTVPEVAANRKCRPNAQFFNWFGGGGIMVSGEGNQIEHNRIAGLLYASGDVLSTPDNSITLEDGHNLVRNNVIGIDSAGYEAGTCGRGIILTDSGNRVESNTIVNAVLEGGIGIRGSDTSLGANTVLSNTVKGSPESIFIFPPTNDQYEYFNPAKITSIEGTTVQGTSGDPGYPPQQPPVDSTCLGCLVQIFLDDTNVLSESLQILGTVASSPSDGSWTFELDQPLEDGQYLRTTSTSVAADQIHDFGPGATTRTSIVAYGPDGELEEVRPVKQPAQPEPPSFAGLLPALRDVPELSLPTTYNRVITVETTLDYNVSRSQTCESEANEPDDSACTLRRAIVETNQISGPVLIQFNIPTSDPGYDAALGIWKIAMSNQVGSGELEIRGGVVLDGTTQPGGRAASVGPSVFVVGSNNFARLVLRGENNVVRGLGWQQVELQITSSATFIEENWFGLSDDGQRIYFIDDDVQTDNNSTIETFEGTSAIVIRGNVLAGSRDRAVVLRSSDSFIVSNFVGTRSDGTVPETTADLCESDADAAWFAGAGILVSGDRNQVGGPADLSNVLGHIFTFTPAGAVQPPAIETTGALNMVYHNVIGRDAAGTDQGVCGEGVRADGHLNRFEQNMIVGATLAIRTAGATSEYRSNVLRDNVQAIGFTQALADLANYNPAQITAIENTTVRGTSGAVVVTPEGQVFDPTCPFCTIELFADQAGEPTDALESLAVTTADAEGNWTATLARPLQAGEGIRTTTSMGDYASMLHVLNEVGFTTRLSEQRYTPDNLAGPASAVRVFPTGLAPTPLVDDGGTIEIEVPADAFVNPVLLFYTSIPSSTISGLASNERPLFGLLLEAEYAAGGPVQHLDRPLTVRFSYSDAELAAAGISEDTLQGRIQAESGAAAATLQQIRASGPWQELPACLPEQCGVRVLVDEDTIEITTDAVGTFAIIGATSADTTRVALPVVLR